MPPYPVWRVSSRDRGPLLAFMLHGLRSSGCRIIQHSPPSRAPFQISFELPTGERTGIVAYAFLANTRTTVNRPADEHRFQVKYGTKDGLLHPLWQDPYGLYTTLFVGIDPARGYFVGADPVLHSPTRFFISIEFKERHIDGALKTGWTAWERDRRQDDQPVEVLVAGTPAMFLRYIAFEREALGEDQGHRHLLAERSTVDWPPRATPVLGGMPGPSRLHALAHELDLSEAEVMDLIQQAPRLKMAVRGWVAEEHLARRLRATPGIAEAVRVEGDREIDVIVRLDGCSESIGIQCKNVLRKAAADGSPRVDFQRTRASRQDACSRYYTASDFPVVAACLHAVTESWEFRYTLSRELDAHQRCPGRLASNVKVDERWLADPMAILQSVF